MKYVLPVLGIALATAAQAHEGGHLHPHESNGWLAIALLLGLGAVGGFLVGWIHR